MSTLRFGSRLLALAALVVGAGCGGKVVFDGNGSGAGGSGGSTPQSACDVFCGACATQAGGVAAACSLACLEAAAPELDLGCDDEVAAVLTCAAGQPSCDPSKCDPSPLAKCVAAACPTHPSSPLCGSTGGGSGGGL